MNQDYTEHESYGEENRDDKVVVFTLDKTPTPEQWRDFLHKDKPDLQVRLEDLDYCDGDTSEDGFEDDWEKTDICPRGLIGYAFKGNQIKIWASEAITPELFLEAVRYTLSESAKAQCFVDARILNVVTTGNIPALSFTGGATLNDMALSLAAKPASKEKKPKPPEI